MEKAPKRVPNYTGDVAASSLKKMQAERQRKLTEKIINDFGWQYGYTTTRLSGDSVMTTKLTGARDLLPVDYVTVHTPLQVIVEERIEEAKVPLPCLFQLLSVSKDVLGTYSISVHRVDLVDFSSYTPSSEVIITHAINPLSPLYSKPIAAGRFDLSNHNEFVIVTQKNYSTEISGDMTSHIYHCGWGDIGYRTGTEIKNARSEIEYHRFRVVRDGDEYRLEHVSSSLTEDITRDSTETSTLDSYAVPNDIIWTDVDDTVFSRGIRDVYVNGSTIKLLSNCYRYHKVGHTNSMPCLLHNPHPDSVNDPDLWSYTENEKWWVEFGGSSDHMNETEVLTTVTGWEGGAEYGKVVTLTTGEYAKGHCILNADDYVYGTTSRTRTGGGPGRSDIYFIYNGGTAIRTQQGVSPVYTPDNRWTTYQYYVGAHLVTMNQRDIADAFLDHSAFMSMQYPSSYYSLIADMRFDIQFSYVGGFLWENFDCIYGFTDPYPEDLDMGLVVENDVLHYYNAVHAEIKAGTEKMAYSDKAIGAFISGSHNPGGFGGLKWGMATVDDGFKIHVFRRTLNESIRDPGSLLYVDGKVCYTFPSPFFLLRHYHSVVTAKNWLMDINAVPVSSFDTNN